MDNQHEHTRKQVKRRNEMVNDRLSNLPDHLIYHILSFMDTRYAVQTSVLSKKWRHYWANIDGLILDSETFDEWMDFRKFVIRVFRYRNPFNLCKLKYSGRASLLERVLCYAKSQSLEELDLNVFVLDSLPPSLYACEALRTFKLGPCSLLKVPDSFAFASLTTLQLYQIRSLHAIYRHSCDLFSRCLNLENLMIMNCSLLCSDTFIISCPRLVNLVISKLDFHRYGNKHKILISPPSLKSFDFDGIHLPVLSMDKCLTLERVNLHICSYMSWREVDDWKEGNIKDLICMAEGLYHAKSLKIILSFSKGIMKNKIKTCQGKFILSRSTHDAETEIMEFKEEELRELPTSFHGRSCVSARDLRRLVKAHKAELKRKNDELEDKLNELEHVGMNSELKEQVALLKRVGEELKRQGEEMLQKVESTLPSRSSG